MKRVLDVARIQAVSWAAFSWQLGFLVSLFLPVPVIAGVIGDATPLDVRIILPVMMIYLFTVVSHLRTMMQMFPFLLGLSVTRRAIYAGTAVVVAAQSMISGLVLLVLERVERVTGGWGISLQFFGLGFLHQDNLVAQWLVYAVPLLAFSAVGVFMGVVRMRWGRTGLHVANLGNAVLLAGLAILVGRQGWWTAAGSFLTDQPTFVLLAGYTLVIALAFGGAGRLAIRRATP